MKNKILTISVIFILLSFIFINNNVFAASYDLSDHKNHISDKSWCIVYSYSSENFYLLVSDNTTYKYFYTFDLSLNENGIYTSNGEFLVSSSYGSSPYGSQGNFHSYVFDKDTLVFNYLSQQYTPASHFNCGECEIIASNLDIYNPNKLSIFFQATPVPSVVRIAPMTLSEELEKIQVQEMWKILMKNVVISLLVFVVSYLALRKAWSFLRTQLKGS